MRQGEARPGQRVAVFATDVGRRLEGYIFFEEDVSCVIAVSYIPFAEAHP